MRTLPSGRPIRLPLAFAAALLAATAPAAAAPAADAPAAATPDPRPVRTRVEVRRTAAPPELERFAAAMERGEDPAPEMARVEGFITRYPYDGLEGSERTVVYLAYDDANLYAVWLCFDREPDKVRAPSRRRDQIPDEDDSVALQIDTFQDQQHLIGFQSSVNGAINDGTYTEGQGWDMSNDLEWTPRGRMTANGYVIHMTIPFRALRFPPGEVQDWGFLMFRGIGRKNEADFFPWYSTTIASRMLQTGTLAGIEVRPDPHRWQLTPFVTADDTRLRDVAAGGPWQESGGAEVGVDGKLVWQDRLVWDFTVNPDFSQVESDEPKVLSNQRFEVYFPEKRPFFIENAGYFSTPIELVFTRRIVEPNAGLRLTGQDGAWAVSGLMIDDAAPPDAPVAGEGHASLLYGGLRRRGADDSSLGGALMRRNGPTAATTLASFDGRQRLDPQWVTAFQYAASRETPDGAAAGPEVEGAAWHLELAGSGRLWSYSAIADSIDDGFRAPIGFVPRLGIRQLEQTASKRFETKRPWLLGIGPYADLRYTWDLDGLRLDQAFRLRLDAELPRATWLYLYLDDVHERLTPDDYPALAGPTDFAQRRVGVSWRSAFDAAWLLTGEAHWGDYVNFVPAAGAPPTLGQGSAIELTATWFPTTALELTATWLETAHENAAGQDVFLTQIARLKVVHHFAPDWQLRLIIDEGAVHADPALTSLTTEHALGGDLLVQWLPTPGNAFYLGLSHRLDSLPASGAPAGLDRPGALEGSGHSVFVKFSRRFDL